MREYIVPVVFRTVDELVVKAETQAEAIDIVNEKIKNNPNANSIYDNYKILETEIECLQDDEIINDVQKFFKMDDDRNTVTINGLGCAVHKEDKVTIDEENSSNLPGATIEFENQKDGLVHGDNVKTYSSYSGADTVFSLNGKVYGEILSFDFNYDPIFTEKNEIRFNVNIFSSIDSTSEDFMKANNATIIQVLCNGLGQNIYRKFNGVRFKSIKSNNRIDDLNLEETYIFDFFNVTPFMKIDKDTSIMEVLKNA